MMSLPMQNVIALAKLKLASKDLVDKIEEARVSHPQITSLFIDSLLGEELEEFRKAVELCYREISSDR